MIYTISNKPSNSTILNLGITFDPPDEIAQVFFTGTDIYYFPALLNDVVVEKLFGTGMVGVKFYHDLYVEDYAQDEIFNEDEVRLSHQLWGITVMNKKLFIEILYEYADKLLTVYRYNTELQKSYARWLEWNSEYNFLNPNWGLAMQEGLVKLKATIDQ